MAKYLVTVKTVKTGEVMTFMCQEKKEATDFANYYRRKDPARDKKYEVKTKTFLLSMEN